MHAKAVWSGRMSFTGSADTGFELLMDASAEVGGDDRGFHPMELIAIGLAGCTAMDVISILQKKRQQVTAFEVHVRAARAAEHPKVFTDIQIEYRIRGEEVSAQAVERAIELSETRYCPAQAMLRQVVPIARSYQIEPEVAAASEDP
jgi:putative redox protein